MHVNSESGGGGKKEKKNQFCEVTSGPALTHTMYTKTDYKHTITEQPLVRRMRANVSISQLILLNNGIGGN